MASSTQTTDVVRKELLLRSVPNGMLYEFYYEGGGEVPQDLNGYFTDSFHAEKAKKGYLEKRDGKSARDTKTK